MNLERLRSAGLSRPKANYILGIAEKAASGSLPTLKECDQLGDTEIMARLTELNGVGRWTVEMFLIFNLGRLDVLPVHDLGVRRGFQIAYGKSKIPEPEQLERFGEKWRPYRTVAAMQRTRPHFAVAAAAGSDGRCSLIASVNPALSLPTTGR